MAEIKCPCGLRNHMEEDDCKKTNCNACCPLTEPQTNADRIRAMSDEELAEFLRWDVCIKIKGDNRMCNGWCDECVLEWLKQPADGE